MLVILTREGHEMRHETNKQTWIGLFCVSFSPVQENVPFLKWTVKTFFWPGSLFRFSPLLDKWLLLALRFPTVKLVKNTDSAPNRHPAEWDATLPHSLSFCADFQADFPLFLIWILTSFPGICTTLWESYPLTKKKSNCRTSYSSSFIVEHKECAWKDHICHITMLPCHVGLRSHFSQRVNLDFFCKCAAYECTALHRCSPLSYLLLPND